MIVFATGISGSDKLTLLKEVAKLSQGKIKVLDIGELMFKKSKDLGINIPEGKILDMDTFALSYLRAVTFEELLKIRDEYKGDSDKDLIISTHTCFRWKKHLVPAFNFYYLNQLSPDLYITIVDNAHVIKARLEKSKWCGRLSLKEVLIWRDEEAFITEMLAEYQKKPFYIIARNEPPETLYNILRHVEGAKLRGNEKPRLKVYLSYPITYVKGQPNLLEEKDKVKERLREAGIVVFDPISVEEADILGLAREAERKGLDHIDVEVDDDVVKIPISEIEDAREDILDQIVARDYKLIDQSDAIVVYYPVKYLSPGVLSEMHYGFTHNKEVYAIFPLSQKSPFFTYYTTAIYEDVDSLLEDFKARNLI